MHKVFTSVLTAVFCLALSSAFAADPTTDEQKTFYALGVALSASLWVAFNLSAAELEMVQSGLTDGVLKTNPKGQHARNYAKGAAASADPHGSRS